METQVIGSTMPVLEVSLQPGESVVAEGGELSWMTNSVEMHTATNKAGGGGVFGALKRTVSGGKGFNINFGND